MNVMWRQFILIGMRRMSLKKKQKSMLCNIETRPQVLTEECLSLMSDYAKHISSQLEPQVGIANGGLTIQQAILSKIINLPVEAQVMQKIAETDDYLRTVTTFMVIGKDKLKEEINNIIDKKFMFIENDIKKANEAM